MNWFLIPPHALGVVILVALYMPLALYLLSLREKSAATWWLVFIVCAFGLGSIGSFLRFSIYWPALEARTWLSVLFWLELYLMVLLLWAYMQFSYVLLGNPFPREARRVRLGTGAVILVIGGLFVYGFFVPGWVSLTQQFLALVAGSLFIWAVVVFARKWRRAQQESDPEALRAARAYRTYLLLTTLVLLGIILNAPQIFGFSLPGGAVLGLIGGLAFIGFSIGLVVAYINYSAEPTSFQAKLVGLTLIAVLATLWAVTLVLFPPDAMQGGEPIPAGQALQLVPDAAGGYQLGRAGLLYEIPSGEDLDFDDDTTAHVALPFRFPFGGEQWDSVYVSANGAVSFGEPINWAGSTNSFFDAGLKIAPLYMDLDPSAGGGVYVEADSLRALISWHDVPRFDAAGSRNRVQLLLHRSGLVGMVYDQVEIPQVNSRYGLRGIVTGDAVPEPVGTAWGKQLPLTLASGTGLVEDFGLAQRQHFHAATRGIAWLIVGSTLFILLVFPFFFRSSLARPLERLLAGVKRVNAGELDAEVPVGVRDEIGYLTHHFNRMTQSLRRYNGEMEALVEERTAALNQSLGELRATQQQLVHSEKMASLGALTAGIAHEIKNPLNFINNFASLARELVSELEEETDPEEVQAILSDLKLNTEKIEEHGKRADGIVRSMMQHARAGSGERERVDLNALVAEHIALAYHGKRAQIPDFNAEIEQDLGAGVGRVELVPQDLGRVLLNLVGNAFDAVRERSLSVNGQYGPTVNVSTRRVGDQVEIRVADNGPGIAEEVREKIFEPFFTTKPTGSGTGLGLSLSYDIITQGHGGTLQVEGKAGHGAAFVVTLPDTHEHRPDHP